MEITREELLRSLASGENSDFTHVLSGDVVKVDNSTKKGRKSTKTAKKTIKEAKNAKGYTKEDIKLMKQSVMASLHGSSASTFMTEEIVDKAFSVAQEVVKRFKELER